MTFYQAMWDCPATRPVTQSRGLERLDLTLLVGKKSEAASSASSPGEDHQGSCVNASFSTISCFGGQR